MHESHIQFRFCAEIYGVFGRMAGSHASPKARPLLLQFQVACGRLAGARASQNPRNSQIGVQGHHNQNHQIVLHQDLRYIIILYHYCYDTNSSG